MYPATSASRLAHMGEFEAAELSNYMSTVYVPEDYIKRQAGTIRIEMVQYAATGLAVRYGMAMELNFIYCDGLLSLVTY